MKFRATVIPSGNATAVEVPAEVIESFGSGKRPKIIITINGHTWRSAVMAKDGRFVVGVSAANRAGSGIAEGDEVQVDLELDTVPRVVEVPPDLARALAREPAVRAAWDSLAYTHRRRAVLDIEAAKTEATREKRVVKVIDTLRATLG